MTRCMPNTSEPKILNHNRAGWPAPAGAQNQMDNTPKQPFIDALEKLALGMAAIPEKQAPLKDELSAAQEKAIRASFGLGLPGAGESEIENFQDGIRAMRMACYSWIRHYTELIELMDTANREVSAIVKKCKDNESGPSAA